MTETLEQTFTAYDAWLFPPAPFLCPNRLAVYPADGPRDASSLDWEWFACGRGDTSKCGTCIWKGKRLANMGCHRDTPTLPPQASQQTLNVRASHRLNSQGG